MRKNKTDNKKKHFQVREFRNLRILRIKTKNHLSIREKEKVCMVQNTNQTRNISLFFVVVVGSERM